MLTKLGIRNFKRFNDVEIELGKSVVFVGPNNSGKTTALQALALWEIGLRRWNEKRQGKTSPEKRPGVTINRRDLISLPIPDAHLLWRDLRVRNVSRKNGSQETQPICINISVEGLTGGASWTCGLEFDFANDESFYCRPLRTDRSGASRMPIPEDAGSIRFAFLPPMSGLVADESKLEPGRINVLIGEGQTAQVLRNLCFRIYNGEKNKQPLERDAAISPEALDYWRSLCSHIEKLFGVQLLPPEFLRERGEITMCYQERGKTFDLSSSGRGLQQTLLLLAYLYSNPHTVLLLDEPDAHLEILRQRQIYGVLTRIAEQQGSQIIIASHSEVILNEAAGRDMVVAFLGKPHRMDDRGSQLLKALKDIGFEDYYQAEQRGWILYLEGSTDLEILRSLAEKLNHPVKEILENPFVCYIGGNQPQKAREHFYALREAKPDLLGIALFDLLDRPLNLDGALIELMWKRREIENYICTPVVLEAYAKHGLSSDDLVERAEADNRVLKMKENIDSLEQALRTQRKPSPWSSECKVTDEFLDPLFINYFEALNLPMLFRKSDYHELAQYIPIEQIDPEVKEKLDAILEVAKNASPLIDEEIDSTS